MPTLLRVALGAFELSQPYGDGQRWAALHESGLPAAVRIWPPAGAVAVGPLALAESLSRLSGLSHPRVVPTLDVGLVPTSPALQRSGLPAGAPWVATPAARSGSLESVLHGTRSSWDDETGAVVRWPVARQLLLDLLDVLAHAHARDVLHLNLVPSAVVFDASVEGPPPRGADALQLLGLTDWSPVARSPHRARRPGSLGGQPGQAAPEQLTGQHAALGPWTDLYALGTLAWRLLTGDHAFEAADAASILDRQRHDGPGAFRARFPVPAELEGWLRVLLAPDPHRRFACAADARRALLALGPAESADAVAVLDAPTLNLNQAHIELLTTGRPPSTTVFSPPRTRPLRWTEAARAACALPTGGAEVAHPATLTALWSRLQSCHRAGRGHAAWLVGDPAESEAVVQTLAVASREVGLTVDCLTVRSGGPAHERGVGPALLRAVGAWGCSRQEAEDAVRDRLRALGVQDDWVCAALAAEQPPALTTDETQEAGTTPITARRPSLALLAARALAALATRRPVLVWVQPDPDRETLAVLDHLMRRQGADPARVFVVFTGARPTLPAGVEPIPLGKPAADALLLPVVDRVSARLGAPLSPAGLVDALLTLAGPDRATTAGLLAAIDLSDGILSEAEAWMRWGSQAESPLTALLALGVLHPTSPAHGPAWWAPRSLLRVLDDHPALAEARSALRRQTVARPPRNAHDLEQVGAHALELGDANVAWSSAVDAARLWLAARRPHRAARLADLARAAWSARGQPSGRRAHELALLSAESALATGRPTQALERLSSLEAMAPDLTLRATALEGRAHAALGQVEAAVAALSSARGRAWEQQNAPVIAQSSFALAAIWEQQGQPARAVPLLREVLGLPLDPRAPERAARARVALGQAALAAGDFVEAGAQLRQAAREVDAQRAPALAARVRIASARVHRLRSRPVEARRLASRAVAAAQRLGDPDLLASAWSLSGALQFDAGDLDAARRSLTRATGWAETTGGPLTVAWLRLGRVQLAQGDLDGATALLEATLGRCVRSGQPVWERACNAALVEAAAARRDWVVFDVGLGELGQERWEHVAHVPEIADPLERAAALATQQGHAERALAAAALAADLWRRVGHHDRASLIEQRVPREDAPTEEAPRWLLDLD